MRSSELRRHRTFLMFFFALFFSSCIALTASAQVDTDNAVAKAFLQNLQDRGLTLTHVGPVTVDNDVLSIGGLEGYPNVDPTKRFKIGDLALAQASVESDGRVFVGAFAASKFEVDEPDFNFTADRIAITDLYLPNADDLSNPASNLPTSLYSTVEVMGLLFQDRSTGQSMPIERISIDFDVNNGGFPIIASVQVANIVLSRSMFAPPQQQLLDELGLPQVNADIDFEGEWNGDTGEINIPSAAVVLKDLFSVQVSLKLEGLTDTVVEQITELATKDNVIALDLLQSAAVSSFNLSLINEGSLDDMLERQAHRHGQSRSTYVKQLTEKAEKQFAIIPDRAKQLEFTEAIYSFLQNPQSITLSANPKAPISVTQILGVSAISPASIISLLGIALQANVN
ncbi:hypothetical protein SAMN04488518_10794 [Pseudovibrio ascidiaceicola]|uniref:Uncharacterized protein n=1 Tax=Pseudovibrio ascidiaceicola TaxID=285279 RepID=A0A1I4B2M0_9HYPH|nr:hypothetical protein [Pseudovibrio ascidiaceicola]SFK63035.1 hypothetical protein SAMN04488518_10794 [Pseudovibrio ascidiaceicola]